MLAAYDWPGNVRELAAVLDRAVILGVGERLEVAKALGTGVRQGSLGAGRLVRDDATAPVDDGAPIVSLDRAMALHIEAALARCAGRIEGLDGAARLLEINPHTLRARMRKLGIDWNRFRRGRSSRVRGGPR